MLRARRFQSQNHVVLEDRFGERVLNEPRLEDGRRPDHVVLTRDRRRVESVLDSKFKREVTHADVDQLEGYAEALRPQKLAFIVRDDTRIRSAVADRIERRGIDVYVGERPGLSGGEMFGVAAVGFGVGLIARELASANGSSRPTLWGALFGLGAAAVTFVSVSGRS